jgi:hypothetical protein
MSTYAFKNIVGAFTHPDVGIFPFFGQQGVKTITIVNTVDRGVIDIASDGAAMISYVAGANGSADIEMQQQSTLHLFLTNWANFVFTVAENGDLFPFAAAALKVKDLLTGEQKVLTGVFPLKIPDVPYGNVGGNVTWRLMAANVTNH